MSNYSPPFWGGVGGEAVVGEASLINIYDASVFYEVVNFIVAVIIFLGSLDSRYSEDRWSLYLVDLHFGLYIFFLFHIVQCLFDDNFHSFAITLHDVDTLLRLVEALALQVEVFSLVVGNGVESVDGSSAVVVETNGKHLGCSSR